MAGPTRLIACAAGFVIVAILLAAVWADRHRGLLGAWNGSRLMAIARSVDQYSRDHHGLFPDTLAHGLQFAGFGPDMARCPESNYWATAADATFVYVGRGLTAGTADGHTVVAYAPVASAGDGSNVLFGDGHVAWVTAADLPAVLARGGPATRPATLP